MSSQLNPLVFIWPILKEHFGLFGTFAIHAAICFLYFIYVKRKIPETKGRSLEEIEAILIKEEVYPNSTYRQ